MRKLISMIVLALVVSACTAEGEISDNGWTNIGGSNYVKLVRVGGVECVILDGYNTGGVDCDWRHR